MMLHINLLLVKILQNLKEIERERERERETRDETFLQENAFLQFLSFVSLCF